MALNAKVVLDSVSEAGDRLTTMEATFHRYVLAEFNTHRMFSRNSASSRAIPVAKQIEAVMKDPALPIEWGSNKSGMQAGPSFEGQDAEPFIMKWLQARDKAVETVRCLSNWGLHKQVANRILEPFMWHTVIVTATDWGNFFDLRCSPMAQPELRAVAELMREAYLASTPSLVKDGQWHTPFIQEDEEFSAQYERMISSARCARVSFLTHDGIRDPEKDLGLFDRLTSERPMHSSPLEHVATPGHHDKGNFRGWTQYRHLVETGWR